MEREHYLIKGILKKEKIVNLQHIVNGNKYIRSVRDGDIIK